MDNFGYNISIQSTVIVGHHQGLVHRHLAYSRSEGLVPLRPICQRQLRWGWEVLGLGVEVQEGIDNLAVTDTIDQGWWAASGNEWTRVSLLVDYLVKGHLLGAPGLVGLLVLLLPAHECIVFELEQLNVTGC